MIVWHRSICLHGFTGQTADAVAGLYWYRFRYYDPSIGRFVQPDTVVPDWTNPQALNRYAYALNNPLRYVDPSGHASVLPGATGGGPRITTVPEGFGGPLINTPGDFITVGPNVTILDDLAPTGPRVTVVDAPDRGPDIFTDGGYGKTSLVRDADLYRGMRAGDDGKPTVGQSARDLGARPGKDVPVDDYGRVRPQTGGMSVTPDDMNYLPDFRKTAELGGKSTDPIFRIDDSQLGDDLTYRPDPRRPDEHGFVEPSREMSLTEYQAALADTRDRWERVQP